MPTERKRRDRRKTNGEYDVGYGKPPKEHRFPPGRSGNPAGGRKKARNFDRSRLGELVDKEASRKVVINGEEMTAEQALIRSMFLNGIKGKVPPAADGLEVPGGKGERSQKGEAGGDREGHRLPNCDAPGNQTVSAGRAATVPLNRLGYSALARRELAGANGRAGIRPSQAFPTPGGPRGSIAPLDLDRVD
jgi:hypothetical protein